MVFNRPDTTKKVLDRIREIKPEFLYIAADGPRPDKEGDVEKCQAVRKLVLDEIDWECDIKTNFRDQNLGCGKAVSQAISWFFEHVEEGIILEDDCLPHPSFFSYCDDLLSFHRNDDQVLMISGNNFLSGKVNIPWDYYFSSFVHIWGWATWRRVWKEYDLKMVNLNSSQLKKQLDQRFGDRRISEQWIKNLSACQNGEIDTWDYQLQYLVWNRKGLTVMPKNNLVSNIGFGPEATHTTEESKFSNLPSEALSLKTRPKNFAVFEIADKIAIEELYGRQDDEVRNKSFLGRNVLDPLKTFLGNAFPKFLLKYRAYRQR
ncbi:nucleotide-diphospho-sugar transferase [Algoriphagus mannitolivorans]|uniref:nucleotide-diphospho-sugar transferase n=1 Tax=Algoriphagus mannitolivorans TaxID=226504 RepID=UPI0012FBD62A|nr:nucleotide-diphospho-sugar transferase [Algoriphagus mannitolivorans]